MGVLPMTSPTDHFNPSESNILGSNTLVNPCREVSLAQQNLFLSKRKRSGVS